MILKDLLIDLKVTLHGDQSIDIQSVTDDSREVKPGTLFVAVKGVHVDGHKYIDKAIEKGAVAIIAEEGNEYKVVGTYDDSIVFAYVQSSHEALGVLASAWYGHPSTKLKLVGITGTNGKTTAATLLYKLMMSMGYPSGLLSTVRNYINNTPVEATHTTPDPLSLNRLIAEMVTSGCEYAFMEVSSHAAEQKRIAGLKFAGGVFTNLTRDHLDYHLTVQNYLNAKKSFFDKLPVGAFALTNQDDKNGLVMLQNTKATKYSYALKSMSDFKATIIERHLDSTELEIDGEDVTVRMVGDFNAYNILAVYGTARLLGMTKNETLTHLSKLTSVDGRFQTMISEKKGYMAIVDYAHTPDALVNVLETIRPLIKGDGIIFTVVGCGGDRDRGKRPIMAHEACRLSDRLIITSDNPRTEEPQAIIEEMKSGLNDDEVARTLCIENRREAIRTACMMAKQNDIILIAGKGHETYQDIQGVKHHFDDREVVAEVFAIE